MYIILYNQFQAYAKSVLKSVQYYKNTHIGYFEFDHLWGKEKMSDYTTDSHNLKQMTTSLV